MSPDSARRATSEHAETSGEDSLNLVSVSDPLAVGSAMSVRLSPERKDIALEAALQRVTSGTLQVVAAQVHVDEPAGRSEERRVGKECRL